MTKTNEWEKRIDYLLKHQEDCVIFDEIKREVNYLLTQKDAEIQKARKEEKEIIKSIIRVAKDSAEVDRIASRRLRDLLDHSELDQPNQITL